MELHIETLGGFPDMHLDIHNMLLCLLWSTTVTFQKRELSPFMEKSSTVANTLEKQ